MATYCRLFLALRCLTPSRTSRASGKGQPMRRLTLCIAALALCVSALQRPYAQSRQQASAATIVGSVVDGRLQPLPGVRVTLLRSGAASLTRTTDTNGRYQFDSVPLGTYTI